MLFSQYFCLLYNVRPTQCAQFLGNDRSDACFAIGCALIKLGRSRTISSGEIKLAIICLMGGYKAILWATLGAFGGWCWLGAFGSILLSQRPDRTGRLSMDGCSPRLTDQAFWNEYLQPGIVLSPAPLDCTIDCT